jgi:hypothetical protein
LRNDKIALDLINEYGRNTLLFVLNLMIFYIGEIQNAGSIIIEIIRLKEIMRQEPIIPCQPMVMPKL